MSATLCKTLACLAWSLPLAAFAQTAPAPAGSTAMDSMDMPGMFHEHAKHTPKAAKAKPKPARHGTHGVPPHVMQHAPTTAQSAEPMPMAMPGMDHAMPAAQPAAHAGEAMPAMAMPPAAGAPLDRGQPQAMGDMHDMGSAHGAHGMRDMRMQGGAAPPGVRSADYSDGLRYGDMGGMDMLDARPLGMLRLDRLEAFHGDQGNGHAWELNGWYGTDSDKLWLRSEGERERGRLGDADIEALWSHAVAPYWDTQLGLRHDFGGGPSRQWLAFGVQGLAPYWFELEATAYVGSSGRTAARLRADYELLLTQRLILQPELEANLYGKADPARRIGSGLSDASFGLRLRYEIRRQFAPYLGVVWTRRFGGTADFAREENHAVFDRQWVAGFRIWF